MVRFISVNDLDKVGKELALDQEVLARCVSKNTNRFESYDSALLINFDVYNLEKLETMPSPLAIYFSKEHLLFICELQEDADKYVAWFDLESIQRSPTRVLYVFFDKLLQEDNHFLEAMEEDIMDLEDDTLTAGVRAAMQDIIALRRRLLQVKKYYEQLNRIFEGFMENEENFLSHKAMKYFKILDNRIDRLYAHVLNLRDYATQVREAYQAQVDIKNNNLMKLFTVITAIFSPLTLIVGWYGMNLRMPEFGWQFGYPFVIILTLVVVATCLAIFKKFKLL